jgi:hypothetical protein
MPPYVGTTFSSINVPVQMYYKKGISERIQLGFVLFVYSTELPHYKKNLILHRSEYVFLCIYSVT